MTLVEVLIAATLAFLLLGLLLDFFITALRRTNDGRIRVDMQQQAVFALNRWEKDIDRTSATAVSLKTVGNPCVSFTRIDAGLALEERIISWFYDKDKKILVREVYPPDDGVWSGTVPFPSELSPFTPYLPTAVEQDVLIKETSGVEKIMCSEVENFSITDSSGGGNANVQPLHFELELRRSLSTPGQYANFTIKKRYTLRNRF